ncbi:hypothetical protein BN381_660007 [Candidatus Microthrix parvicella RN1]|uniref:Uncharacterized protein n=1 Tax=Candidatus Neomicrothrix parvicella RN1 TaxID=1229780 RepID=R4Z320_9ACTN|nr:hypothetical protein BN381_660007 [Candidatus Microthrix parvicella RN1]
MPPPHPRHDCVASWCSTEGDQRTPRPRKPSVHAQAIRPRDPRHAGRRGASNCGSGCKQQLTGAFTRNAIGNPKISHQGVPRGLDGLVFDRIRYPDPLRLADAIWRSSREARAMIEECSNQPPESSDPGFLREGGRATISVLPG